MNSPRSAQPKLSLDSGRVIGAEALVEVLGSPTLLEHPVEQVGTPTYAAKLTSETFHLEPTMASAQVLRVVRLGRAFTTVNGRRLRILSARALSDAPVACGVIRLVDGVVALGTLDGSLALEQVQPEGSSMMDARSWWGGARFEDDPRWT